MKRQCLQKKFFLALIFSFCISLSFFISAYADPFTGAYLYTGTDPVTGLPIVEVRGVNPTGQTFSGSNVIEMNAYNNAPILTNNTFNGSTQIDPSFTDIESNSNTYNGTTNLTYDGVLGGQMESNNDTFATANVTATNAGVEMNNPTFNGSMTLNADNISLGSIDQMDTLLSKFDTLLQRVQNVNLRLDTIHDYFQIIIDSITQPTLSSSNTKTISYSTNSGNRSVTYNLFQRVLDGNVYYMNFSGLFNYYLNMLIFQISMPYNEITTVDSASSKVFNMNGYPVRVYKNVYTIYSYTSSTDVISSSNEYRYSSFYSLFPLYFQRTFLSYFNANITYMADTWYRWYSPRIDPNSNYFWYVYNTDTAQMESINLAGLMYDISWYLGQMYVLQSASQSLDNMADQVEDITDTLEEAEQKENAIISSISSGINNFAPDIQSISAFRALSWCSNYLQQMFVALGVYGTVIMVGLLLGVCMQFIGYFRYK